MRLIQPFPVAAGGGTLRPGGHDALPPVGGPHG
jgi:hypothetical protein